MARLINHQTLLTQAVLASTLFVVQPSFATTFGGNIVFFGPINTSAQADNIVEVLSTGEIQGSNANAVNLNSVFPPRGQVIVDANNTFAPGINAINTIGAAAPAIGVNITGANGQVTVMENSGINATNTFAGSDAIFVNATGANIENAGTIQSSNFSAIHLSSAGTSAIITNSTSGTIQNTIAGTTPTILTNIGNTGLALNNAGLITQLKSGSNLDTILLNAPFGFITNSGTISQSAGGADIGRAINLQGTTAGNITNTSSGIITVTGDGNAILLSTLTTSGNIANAGLIQSNSNSTLVINGNMTSASPNINLNNTGTIKASNLSVVGDAVILLKSGTLSGGITNSGFITRMNGIAGTNAIDLKAGNTTFNQNGGIVTGNVFLAQHDSTGLTGNVFNMNGGSILGDVTAANFAGLMQTFNVNDGTITGTLSAAGGATSNTFNLNGGTIGAVTLGNAGDLVQLAGTNILAALTGGTGADTINVSGGNFGSLNGVSGKDTLNVDVTFTPSGPINAIPNINIDNIGTIFTLNHPITNMNDLGGFGTGLIIEAGATMFANANISGNGGIITNHGLLLINDAQTFTLTGAGSNLTNTSGSTLALNSDSILTLNAQTLSFQNGATFQVDVAGTSSGEIIAGIPGITNTNFALGSFIAPRVKGFIPQGNIYTIVDDTGGTVVDNSTLVQPASATIFFNKINTPTLIQLQSQRRSFASLSGTQFTQGVATTLDLIAKLNGPMIELIALLDQLPTQQDIEDAMESLLPPFNYGLVAGSYASMENIFTGIHDRIFDLHAIHHFRNQRSEYYCINFGDPAGALAFWAKGFGAYENQSYRRAVPGFTVDNVGAAIGGDWGVNDFLTLGVALNYSKTNVDDKNNNPKDQSIKSWQGTTYGWLSFAHGIFLDAMFGFASNDYKTNRVINLIDSSAQAGFDGTQYGVQADLGVDVLSDPKYYFAPFARIKYLRLKLDEYTESGAGNLSLIVDKSNTDELLGGVGFKLNAVYNTDHIQWIPEFSAMIAYDFDNDGEQTQASFIGIGPAFVTNGVSPGATLLAFDFGLNAYMAEYSSVLIKYNLDLREKYVGNAFYLQYYAVWG